jgi:multiple sugar transport system ATP-binding protein
VDVRFDKVTKAFGASVAVDELSLTIDDGEFVVLLGPSGCGKSTTLRMLAGLEEVTAGEIFIGGQCVNDIPPRARDLAMVFQNYALYPHMTVAENIAYPLRIRKLSREEIAIRVERVAILLEIGGLLTRKPRDLSGGERQRVALARAIIREPRAYLMDEPLSNLDARLRVQMRGELKRLQHELGTTTIYVTHDQAEAMTLAHRVAVMRKGKLQQFDSPLNIYNHPENRFVAEFVGSPSMNFIEGRIDPETGVFRGEGIALHLDRHRFDSLRKLDADRQVILGIRPEHVQVSPIQHDSGVPAKVYVTELMGSETFVFVTIGNEKIIARAPGDFRAEVESTVWLHIDMTKAHFFDANTGEAMWHRL